MTQQAPVLNAPVGPGGAENHLRRYSGLVFDALLPPQCLACGVLVEGHGVLCPSCWEQVAFTAPPYCDACGVPFPFNAGPGALCGACTRAPPPFHRARSVLAYDQASRRLVLAFKHGDRTDSAPAFGRWMARAGADAIAESDLVAPVPLHWTRLFARRFNQAALLAHQVGRLSGLMVVPDLLVRRRRTPSQGKLSPSARRRNLRGAFAVRPRRARLAEGKRVLLVDDVFTTGATVNACARTLLRAGADAVNVLTLARVFRPS